MVKSKPVWDTGSWVPRRVPAFRQGGVPGELHLWVYGTAVSDLLHGELWLWWLRRRASRVHSVDALPRGPARDVLRLSGGSPLGGGSRAGPSGLARWSSEVFNRDTRTFFINDRSRWQVPGAPFSLQFLLTTKDC